MDRCRLFLGSRRYGFGIGHDTAAHFLDILNRGLAGICTVCSFLGSTGNLLGTIGNLFHQFHDSGELPSGFFHAVFGGGQIFRTFVHAVDGLLGFILNLADKAGNLAGGFFGLGSQFADFVCDNGKATPGISGTGCFDSGVECEQVGLLGNTGDGIGYAPDFIGTLAQTVDYLCRFTHDFGKACHILNGTGNHLITILGFFSSLLSFHGCPAGVMCHAANAFKQGIHGLGSIINSTKLLVGSTCHIGDGLGYLLACRRRLGSHFIELGCIICHLISRLLDGAHKLAHIAAQDLEDFHHLADFIFAFRIFRLNRFCPIIPMRKFLQASRHKADGVAKALGNFHAQQRHNNRYHQNDDGRNHDFLVESLLIGLHVFGRFGIDIVNPGAGTNNPAIGLKLHHIVALGQRLAFARFRIGKVHKAAAILLAFFQHVFHVGHAVGVFFTPAHFAFSTAVAGMSHADTGSLFIGKEIALAFVITY